MVSDEERIKVSYECEVVGDSYDDLVSNAWKEILNYTGLSSIEEAKFHVIVEMHTKRSMDTTASTHKYVGTMWLTIPEYPMPEELREGIRSRSWPTK